MLRMEGGTTPKVPEEGSSFFFKVGSEGRKDGGREGGRKGEREGG